MRLTIKRLAPGAYLANGRYQINRTREGMIGANGTCWYWREGTSPAATTSQYFDTKTDAINDLREYLTSHCQYCGEPEDPALGLGWFDNDADGLICNKCGQCPR